MTTKLPLPPLPLEHANPFLKNLPLDKLQPVKFQETEKDGTKIIIGRIKISTPSGHTFIIRRYDSGAIHFSSMYRAAYPTATEDYEKAELRWVKNMHDIHGIDKGDHHTLLAGFWVIPSVALDLAGIYHIRPIVSHLLEAQPDPKKQYRSRMDKKSNMSTSAASPPFGSSDDGYFVPGGYPGL